jgi:hypothetical protein
MYFLKLLLVVGVVELGKGLLGGPLVGVGVVF